MKFLNSINLLDILAVKKVKLPALNLEGFDTFPLKAEIENNGHTGLKLFRILKLKTIKSSQ